MNNYYQMRSSAVYSNNNSSSYRGIELFHNASVFGKKEDLYAVEFVLGTMRVFLFEILVL